MIIIVHNVEEHIDFYTNTYLKILTYIISNFLTHISDTPIHILSNTKQLYLEKYYIGLSLFIEWWLFWEWEEPFVFSDEILQQFYTFPCHCLGFWLTLLKCKPLFCVMKQSHIKLLSSTLNSYHIHVVISQTFSRKLKV